MTSSQLRRFWATMDDIAEQVPLMIAGEPTMADREDWRLVFCAAYKSEQRIAEGLNGQKVVLGQRLRDVFAGMDEEQKSRALGDLIDIATAFGNERGVIWSDPAQIKEAA